MEYTWKFLIYNTVGDYDPPEVARNYSDEINDRIYLICDKGAECGLIESLFYHVSISRCVFVYVTKLFLTNYIKHKEIFSCLIDACEEYNKRLIPVVVESALVEYKGSKLKELLKEEPFIIKDKLSGQELYSILSEFVDKD